MIIDHKRWRIPLTILVAILLIMLTFFVFAGGSLINVVDNLTFFMHSQVFPNWLRTLTLPAAIFSVGWGNAFAVGVLAFLLWGFKFKIPATWMLLTNIFGWVAVEFLGLILRHRVFETYTQYPNHAAFFSTLLIMYISILVLPEMKPTKVKTAMPWILALFFIGTAIHELVIGGATPSDLIAGWLFAIIWLFITEHLYVRYAQPWRRRVIFRNSWY